MEIVTGFAIDAGFNSDKFKMSEELTEAKAGINDLMKKAQ
jgi:hypothetical protein